MEDEKIIAKLWCRDESALSELERSHKKPCMTQALRITENISDAEECWNDTCLAVWNSIPPTRPTSLQAYVIRIIRNISLNFVKAKQTEKRAAIIVELSDYVCDDLPDMEQSELGALIDEFLEASSKAEKAPDGKGDRSVKSEKLYEGIGYVDEKWIALLDEPITLKKQEQKHFIAYELKKLLGVKYLWVFLAVFIAVNSVVAWVSAGNSMAASEPLLKTYKKLMFFIKIMMV